VADPRLELIDALSDATFRRRSAAPDEIVFRIAKCVDVLRVDYAATDSRLLAAESDALASVGDLFDLDPIDRAILFACALGELDSTVSLAYALLRGLEAGSVRCTVALAMELSGMRPADGLDRLGQRSPLRRHDLLRLSTAEPWSERIVTVPDSVVRVLAGLPPADPVVDAMRVEVEPLEVDGVTSLANALLKGSTTCWVQAHHGAAGASLAAGAMRAAGVSGLVVDLRLRPGAVSAGEAVGIAIREAGLSGRALIVTGADELAAAAQGAFDRLRNPAVPVVLIGSRPWQSSWLPDLPFSIETPPLTVDERQDLWVAAAGPIVDEESLSALRALRLGPEDIAAAVRFAQILAGAANEPVSGAVLRTAARRVGGSGAVAGGRIINSEADRLVGFADLIVRDETNLELRRLASWAKNRDAVARRGLFAKRGRGITALFAGNSGTGKTLAARVLAEELSLDLYQVDLSAVVDKYIGETEKNLEKVFQTAEALNVILFFDEADALFGSRSEVRDSKDRYANQEVAYLLQRIEDFDGIIVLASNLRGNLDRAFSRRMNFIVTFPDPDPATRRRLWQHHLEQLDEVADQDSFDLGMLADSLEIAGGDIRNAVLAAAYDAADQGVPVAMKHLAAAALRESRKLGKVTAEQRLTAYL
jgi:AAA+ superfamily predicted ATPase